MKFAFVFLSVFILSICPASKAQSLYFPPLGATANWESVSPSSLGWCSVKIDTLYNFLQKENTKGFIVLKDGKIVLEKYFGTFTKDSIWYWASAGKTITSFLIGHAQENGSLSIADVSSKYLGNGWTNCTTLQESKIKIRNQLSMTSGLDDGVSDNHCTKDTCLNYLADAGNRWAYHNAPYTLLEKVLETATGKKINLYTQSALMAKTGMNGLWFTLGYDNIFYSKVRSMARFGLLFQNKCVWAKDTLLKDTAYVNQMTNTSQTLNKGYGYLWWLNGKGSYMIPTLQTVIPGSYAPDAPADMFSGIGKNGQIVSISKSLGIVFVRMGNAPGTFIEVPTVFCNQIWKRLNDVMCNAASIQKATLHGSDIKIYPNPAKHLININLPSNGDFTVEILNFTGQTITKHENQNQIDISKLASGLYFVKVKLGEMSYRQRLIIE